MTLAEELQTRVALKPVPSRLVELLDPPLHLPFNGELSQDERRMLEQFAFEDF